MNTMDRDRNMFPSLEGIVDLRSVMRQVYVWMVLGMLLTAAMAFVTVTTPLANLAANPAVFLVALLAELGVVVGISLGFSRLSSGAATALFFVYAALNGFTLSIIFLASTTGTDVLAFTSTAALFAAMSIIGYTTRVDLSKVGTYLMMALIGLIIALVINLFVNSGPLDTIISIAGVLTFTALTAYDTQRIARMAAQMSAQGEAAARFGILGALKLYLDFVNMFLFMLRLFGRRRR